MLSELKNRGRKVELSRLDLAPIKIVWTQGKVTGIENLLDERERQISLRPSNPAIMESDEQNAAILLDFGCEIHGGARILAWHESIGKGIKVRLRFGESVTEAMSEIGGETNAVNDHARRDIVTEIGSMSMNAIGETGFRFLRIDLIETGKLVLKSVFAQVVYRDMPYRGNFQCSDELVNRIWNTGAYTMHLNTQEYVWDGIKRDRLVWIADMHPEIKTIQAVFGDVDAVKKSLDFIRKETPLPGWMNRIASYTMWYVIILYDWYLYTADSQWIYEQKDYLVGVAKQLQGLFKEDGHYNLDKYECFVDWPSCDRDDVVDAGMKAIHSMALEKMEGLLSVLENYEKNLVEKDMPSQNWQELYRECEEEREQIRQYTIQLEDSKASASLCVLAGLADAQKIYDEILGMDEAKGISTYLGYYILTAMSESGNMDHALDCMKEYFGGMLSLGATTFWEDFSIDWMKNAAPIDRLPKEGEVDIHGTYGGYCYKGLRHSLCHGWASGVTSWITEQVLGVKILEAGCKKVQIRPNLGTLEWAKGTYPTPYGDIHIDVKKKTNGEKVCTIDAPESIVIER